MTQDCPSRRFSEVDVGVTDRWVLAEDDVGDPHQASRFLCGGSTVVGQEGHEGLCAACGEVAEGVVRAIV